jgi:hypothetical protein
MSTTGHYADNRKYTLPESWNPLDEQTLQTALSQTLEALTGDDPLRRLGYFYDPLGSSPAPASSTQAATRSRRSKRTTCTP